MVKSVFTFHLIPVSPLRHSQHYSLEIHPVSQCRFRLPRPFRERERVKTYLIVTTSYSANRTLILPGFAPANEVLLFRQKDPKPSWLWRGPSGSLRGSLTPAARKLAALKQCAPSSRSRLHCSATPRGLGRLLKL